MLTCALVSIAAKKVTLFYLLKEYMYVSVWGWEIQPSTSLLLLVHKTEPGQLFDGVIADIMLNRKAFYIFTLTFTKCKKYWLHTK